MRTRGAAVAAIALLAGFLSTASCAETFRFSFDGRPWHEDFKTSDANQTLTEYALPGETVDDWTEIVTVQSFPGLQVNVTAEGFAMVSERNLRKLCLNMRFRYHKKTSSDVLYEWRAIKCPGQPDQHEIARVVTGKDAIHIMHYATKRVPIDKDVRMKWMMIIANATVE